MEIPQEAIESPPVLENSPESPIVPKEILEEFFRNAHRPSLSEQALQKIRPLIPNSPFGLGYLKALEGLTISLPSPEERRLFPNLLESLTDLAVLQSHRNEWIDRKVRLGDLMNPWDGGYHKAILAYIDWLVANFPAKRDYPRRRETNGEQQKSDS